MEAEVRRLVGFDHWLHNFEIVEPVYCELTLEVLSTFEIVYTQAKLRHPGGYAFRFMVSRNPSVL